MSNLVEHILDKNYDSANEILAEKFRDIMEEKLHEMKKMCAAELSEKNHDIEEGLLKAGKRIIDKLKKPSTIANQEQRPELKTMSGRPLRRLKIEPKQVAEDMIEESEQLDEAPRVSIVKARIRGGKVQRRRKVSNVAGFTMRGGSLKRMSAAERRRRKLGARKAARKTKSKKFQILRKRKMSLIKRKRLGL
jgi:hypothetical protein